MSCYAQLPQALPNAGTQATHNPSRKTKPSSSRIYWLGATVCCGGLLFGYDSGVIGGVLTFASFHDSFRYTPQEQTLISSIAVGIQQAGALAGCLLIWPLTTHYGRRRSMILCSLIFCIGVIFEIINSHSLPIFYIGRIICGLGIGGSATVAPIYLAEMSPAHLRGRLGSGYQFTFTVGIFVSYWIDYGVQYWEESARQWQVPLALQLVPGIAMGLGMLPLKESVRWLIASGDTRAAWESLAWIRNADSAGNGDDSALAVRDEFAEMKRAVDADTSATADFQPRELLHRPNLRRVSLAVSIFIAQQATGATAMAYFGPQFFGLLVGEPSSPAASSNATEAITTVSGESAHSLTLLLTGIFGALKVLSCLFFILFVADRFGRKPLLTFGALAMALCMISTSLVLHSSSPPLSSPASPSSPTSLSATQIFTILLIYLTITLYNLSWGPLPWPLVAELFPTRLRSPGVALAVASQWTSNFIWSFATPYILRGLGWATFLLFGLLDLGIVLFVVMCLPETAGRSLEEVEELFDDRRYSGRDGECDGEDGLDAESEGLVRGFIEREEGGEDYEGWKAGGTVQSPQPTTSRYT
ncbi:general substrate transporter [Aspergillus pseudoustus]|uniref:General substrate transporter n=1 Tax=Aspergillus pseudoustus TaxID=1810923 RepID=A0ABR4KJS9_9EURO